MNHRTLRVTIVDAFTRSPGHGNRAGVVTETAGLQRADMLAAARAVAASETVFVLPAGAGADLGLRYFTPATEVDFCGHATVAAFHHLAETGQIAAAGRFTFECPAGKVEVEVEPLEDHRRVWIATPRWPWEQSPIPGPALMDFLGGGAGMLDPKLPVSRTGSKILVPLARRADLWSLSPRWDDLAAAGLGHEVLGFYVFTLDAEDRAHVAQGRFFAPAMGVREDPVTGSASGPLAEYLVLHDVLALPAAGGTVRARVEQGDAMGKPGRVDLEVTGAPGRIDRVRVGGTAVTVMDGSLWPERTLARSAGAAP